MFLFGKKKDFYNQCLLELIAITGMPDLSKQYWQDKQYPYIDRFKKDPKITPRKAVLEEAESDALFIKSTWESVESNDSKMIHVYTEIRKISGEKAPIWVQMVFLHELAKALKSRADDPDLDEMFWHHMDNLGKTPLPTRTKGLVSLKDWVDLPEDEKVGGLT